MTLIHFNQGRYQERHENYFTSSLSTPILIRSKRISHQILTFFITLISFLIDVVRILEKQPLFSDET